MRKRRTARTILYALLAVLVVSVVYNIYDNHRLIVVEREIVVERLPESFDGFRILQISDLHSRSFGEGQADLVQAINRLDYDMIALTGDMNSGDRDESAGRSKAILNLLDGIENKEHVYWIDGNTGPHAIASVDGLQTGSLTEIGVVLQSRGCRILSLPEAIRRSDDQIWVTPEMSKTNLSMYQSFLSDENWREKHAEDVKQVQVYAERAERALQAIHNGEVKILLAHAPKQTNLTEAELALNGDLDYDLILAGHYHGGQIRLPLIGAVYIPSPTSGINSSGFLPKQSDVKGVSFYGNTPQYVSAGLGASGHIRWLKFRLFNTPEINLITLRRP